MKTRCFVLVAIFATVVMTIVLINEVTQAQDVVEKDWLVERAVTSFADKSWADLTFTLKVDDDTLIKARPIYQKYSDNLQRVVKDRGPGVGRYRLIKAIRNEFQTELQAVLTDAQMTELKEIENKRIEQRPFSRRVK